jgi:hypothetical protein
VKFVITAIKEVLTNLIGSCTQIVEEYTISNGMVKFGEISGFYMIWYFREFESTKRKTNIIGDEFMWDMFSTPAGGMPQSVFAISKKLRDNCDYADIKITLFHSYNTIKGGIVLIKHENCTLVLMTDDNSPLFKDDRICLYKAPDYISMMSKPLNEAKCACRNLDKYLRTFCDINIIHVRIKYDKLKINHDLPPEIAEEVMTKVDHINAIVSSIDLTNKPGIDPKRIKQATSINGDFTVILKKGKLSSILDGSHI